MKKYLIDRSVHFLGGAAFLLLVLQLPAGAQTSDPQSGAPLSRAPRSRSPLFGAPSQSDTAGNHALGQDVTRPYGEYRYVPQKNLYQQTTIGDSIGDLRQGTRDVLAPVSNINRYTSWTLYSATDSYFLGTSLGLNLGIPAFGVQLGSGYSGIQNNRLTMIAGPLVVDSIYAGYGLIYTDIQGNYPGISSLPPNGWAQIVWTSFRATLVLGDSLAISINPYLYWLPDKGEFGWAIPGPMAGLMLPQFGARALFQGVWKKEWNNWRLVVTDQFTPYIQPYNLWDVYVNANQSWGDLSPVERVGRYGVGYGSGAINSYDPNARFGINNDHWSGLNGYYNIIGARLFGRHGNATQSMFYLDRVDAWGKNFNTLYSALNGGAYIRNGDPYFTSYAGYNFSTRSPFFNTTINWAVAGFRKSLTNFLTTYAEGGYYWLTGEGPNYKGWTALVGIQNRLGPRTYQYAEVGRRVYQPFNAPIGLEDFAEYRLVHLLGGRINTTAYAGVSKRYLQFNKQTTQQIQYAGIMMSTNISPRIGSFASAGWEKISIPNSAIEWTQWTYRSGLTYAISNTVNAQAFYQYLDFHGNTYGYTEHYLYLGASKSF